MALDLDAFPAKVRLKQINLGRGFGSEDTLAQANQTLLAHGKYAAAVAADGFVAADATRLAEARDGLIDAGVGREAARGDKKTTGKTYVAAMNAGQTARLSARSILEAARDDLEEAGDEATADKVTTLLATTKASPDLAEPMAAQLDLLRAKLEDAAVKAKSDGRGGVEAAAKLLAAAAALRTADGNSTGGPGTPAETQKLDQLDGIIIGLVRKARKAGIAAGKRLGDPALAAAFKLDKLYAGRGGKGDEGDGEEDGEGEDGGEGDGGSEDGGGGKGG